MAVKVFALILLFSSPYLFGQTKGRKPAGAQPAKSVPPATAADDQLKLHLSAAETYQLTGDLPQAQVENRKAAAIALQRLGFIALEEQDYKKAAKLLSDSVALIDSSTARASLAVAYMRLSENGKALVEARAAVALDPKNVRAYQILGSLYYSKDDYRSALPALEKVFQLAPDFSGAYLLGMSYLRLQQPQRAKLLFEEVENVISKKSPYLYLMFARAFEETDYPQEAEAQFKKGLALDPKAPKVHFYYGYFLLQYGGSGRIAEAAKEFRQELLITPNDFYSYFFLGVIASGQNEHSKAVQYLQKAILLNPKVGQAYLFLGQSQLELGDTVAAERNLRRSIELDSDSSKSDLQVRRSYFLLGRLLIKTGRKTEGEMAFAKARELQGQVFQQARDEIRRIFGEIVSSRGDKPDASLPSVQAKRAEIPTEKAADYRNIKIRLAEVLGFAYNNLGVIAVQQGNFADSLEQFTAAARWKPNLPGLDRNWGIVYFRLSQFDKAIAPLARQIKADPKDNLVRRMLGVSFYLSKNYKQAAATLEPIEAQLKDDAELAYFYGISLIQSNRNKDADAFFSRLVEQNPKNVQVRFYGAQGFVSLGNYERALKEFRAVAAIDSQMPRVHYNAGQTLIRLNRLDEAEKEFRQELQLNPTDETSKYHLAFTLLERKIQTDEAVNLLNQAIAARPDYADALYQLGKTYLEKGEIDKAIDHLERAVRSDGGKDYAHYQLSIAYRRASRTADADRELKVYRELKAANRQTGIQGEN